MLNRRMELPEFTFRLYHRSHSASWMHSSELTQQYLITQLHGADAATALAGE
jgi:hypothetical protein